MRNKPFLIHLFAFCLLGYGLLIQTAYAEAPRVTSQHSIVALNTDADGRNWLTLNLTLTNHSNEDLNNIKLLSCPDFSLTSGDDLDALEVGNLAIAESVTLEWTFESNVLTSLTDPTSSYVMIIGEATDVMGDPLEFVVDSIGGAE